MLERFLGATEHLFWLYSQCYPLDFATVAKLQGQFNLDQLAVALRQVQQRHPLLRVRIVIDALSAERNSEGTGQPKFVETDDEIPIRLVARTHDQQWQQELEVELARSFDWQVAPLLRVVLLQSGSESELMIVYHHAIADGLSSVYLLQDILQALEGKTFERLDLSTSPSLESAFPGTAPSPEATTKPTAYRTISRGSIPHIRSVVLSTELTQQLIQRSRAEGTTVHGAISAAFLFALMQQDVRPNHVIPCLHAVNVRSHLSLPMPDGVGLYICLCTTTHSLQEDSAFWDVARSVKAQLSQIDIAQQLVEERQLRQPTMTTLTDPTAFVKELQSQYPTQLSITNLGRIKIAQQPGKIQIKALHAPIPMSGVDQGRVVGVATLDDPSELGGANRIALTLVAAPLMDVNRTESNRAATAFLSEGVKRLERAVIKEVSLEDAGTKRCC